MGMRLPLAKSLGEFKILYDFLNGESKLLWQKSIYQKIQ